MFFHGTSQDNAEKILIEGLRDDLPHINGDSMGPGVYCSDVFQGGLIYGPNARIKNNDRFLPGSFRYVFVLCCNMKGLRGREFGRYESNHLIPDTAGVFCQHPQPIHWTTNESNTSVLFSEFIFDPRAVEILYLAVVQIG